MSKQTHIDAALGEILVDWLVEIHDYFHLMPETLYLAVNLVDRFLEKEQTTRSKLQLIGATALFMASKYEEMYPLLASDFVWMSGNAFTRVAILSMECLMLARLNFQLTAPNAFVFVTRFAKVAGIATAPRSPRSTTELCSPTIWSS